MVWVMATRWWAVLIRSWKKNQNLAAAVAAAVRITINRRARINIVTKIVNIKVPRAVTRIPVAASKWHDSTMQMLIQLFTKLFTNCFGSLGTNIIRQVVAIGMIKRNHHRININHRIRTKIETRTRIKTNTRAHHRRRNIIRAAAVESKWLNASSFTVNDSNWPNSKQKKNTLTGTNIAIKIENTRVRRAATRIPVVASKFI